MLIAVALIAMAAATWLKLCDPIIDFGRELYVPWRLTQGDVLYRDIAYFNGPLSPYVNALWFTLFGVGLRTLVIANMGILVVVLWLMYRLVRLAADRITATVACLMMVLVFAFGQYTTAGNFNWICPYSHELTHGLALALGALYLLVCKRRPFLAGLLIGGVLLTKVEVTVATVAMLIPVVIRLKPKALIRLTVAAMIPPLIAALALCIVLPPVGAIAATTGAWRYMFNAVHTVADPYNRSGMGIDHPLANLGLMFNWAGRYLAAMLPGVLLALVARRRQRWWGIPAAIAPMVLLIQWPYLGLADIARPLPIFVAVVIVVAAWRGRSRRTALQASLGMLALGMLLKMILNTRVHHYGFAHTMPAMVVLVILFVHIVPRWISSVRGDGRVHRAAFIVLCLVIASANVRITLTHMGDRTHAVGEGADRFYAIYRGRFVAQTVELVRERTRDDATMAVFPEGVMFNYLARRRVPTRYLNFIPHEVNLYGEQAILDAMRATPPDVVVFVTRDTSAYGFQYFGRDYARNLYAFLLERYPQGMALGGRPFTDEPFGVKVMFPESTPLQ